jgi:hypothetical protein
MSNNITKNEKSEMYEKNTKSTKRDITTIEVSPELRKVIEKRQFQLGPFVNDMIIKWDKWLTKWQRDKGVNIIKELMKDMTIRLTLEKIISGGNNNDRQ